MWIETYYVRFFVGNYFLEWNKKPQIVIFPERPEYIYRPLGKEAEARIVPSTLLLTQPPQWLWAAKTHIPTFFFAFLKTATNNFSLWRTRSPFPTVFHGRGCTKPSTKQQTVHFMSAACFTPPYTASGSLLTRIIKSGSTCDAHEPPQCRETA